MVHAHDGPINLQCPEKVRGPACQEGVANTFCDQDKADFYEVMKFYSGKKTNKASVSKTSMWNLFFFFTWKEKFFFPSNINKIANISYIIEKAREFQKNI